MAKKKRKKRVNRKKKGKGSKFEREICKVLSLWWTKGKRDDVYWRSTTSGARATVRSRKGRGTFGQYGDIQATDPIGQPLLDLCSIELKRGYSSQTISNLLDALPQAQPQMYEKFIEQALADSKKAGSPFWMLIAKRDRREPLLVCPIQLFKSLQAQHKFVKYLKLRYKSSTICAFRLTEFLKYIKPKTIKRLAKLYAH